MADLQQAACDAVAILSDGMRIGVWYDPLSGDEAQWAFYGPDGALREDWYTAWPQSRLAVIVGAWEAVEAAGYPVERVEFPEPTREAVSW